MNIEAKSTRTIKESLKCDVLFKALMNENVNIAERMKFNYNKFGNPVVLIR